MERMLKISIMSVLALALAALQIFGKETHGKQENSDRPKTVVRLSKGEWDSTKALVDKNGECFLEKHGLLIVVTNSAQSVNHIIPHGGNSKRPDGRTRPKIIEPFPYAGQGF